jgi:hypothetical protein
MIQGLLKFFFPTLVEDEVKTKAAPTIVEAKVTVKPVTKAAPKKRGRPKGSKNKTTRSKK